MTARLRLAVAMTVVALVAIACGGGAGDGGDAASTTTGASSSTAPSAAIRATTASWTLPAPVAREVVVASGKEFTVVGGLDATKFSTASVVTVNPATGTSRESGTLPVAVHDAAGVRAGTRILVFGGGGPSENGTADVQAVPGSGAAAVIGTMPGPRSDHVAARVGSTTYLFGGYDGASIVPDVLATTNGTTFTKVGALPVPVRYPALAVVGQAIYVFGGVSNSQAGVDTSTVQRLDVATGVIDTVGTLPTSLSHAGAVVLGGQVFLLGGYVDNTRLSDQILRFDPKTVTATSVGSLPAPVSDGAAVVVGGRGYLVGGQGTDRRPARHRHRDRRSLMPSVRGRAVTDLMARHGHEQVVFVADANAGLRAVIAIHSTALGPSLGGVRFRDYETDTDALEDVLRLSEAMSLKASIAGLHQGGGKAVVRWDDPDRARPQALLDALGKAIDELGGRYLAAEDVGATTADMNGLARVTPWVTGVDEAQGGSGDPSPVTAYGVLCAMRATMGELDGDATLRSRHVVVQGVGHVGAHLARLLVDAGARVTAADVFPAHVDALVRELGVEALSPEDSFTSPCDILAPCALGGSLDDITIPRLRCRAIVGAANNQLDASGADEALAERGILYAPDFVVNGGGIINLAEEFVGYDRARAFEHTARIERTTAEVFAAARDQRVTPARAAELLARKRIEVEGAGRRWQPGDPAAWTNGEPLRRLRPPP